MRDCGPHRVLRRDLRRLEQNARLEVLLRMRAFKPKAAKGGGQPKSTKQTLGIPVSDLLSAFHRGDLTQAHPSILIGKAQNQHEPLQWSRGSLRIAWKGDVLKAWKEAAGAMGIFLKREREE